MMATTGTKSSAKSAVARNGVITGGVSLVLTLMLAVMANSLAMWADVIATLLGFCVIFIAWTGFKKIENPAGSVSDYGFGKFESVSSLAMALLMTGSCLCIMIVAVLRFMNPVPVSGPGVLLGILLHVVFGYLNGNLLLKTMGLERAEKTAMLASQKRFYVIKFGTNALMAMSLVISYFLSRYRWAMWFDPMTATVIAGMILLNATRIMRHSVRDLLDYALEEQSQLLILRALANQFDCYENLHHVRTRLAGGRIYVELFLEFDGNRKHAAVMETVQSLQTEIRALLKCHEVLVIPVGTRSAAPRAVV